MSNKKEQKFEIFLPVIDETFSLEQTINIIEKQSSNFVSRYLILLSKSKSKLESIKISYKLKLKYKKNKIIFQKKIL